MKATAVSLGRRWRAQALVFAGVCLAAPAGPLAGWAATNAASTSGQPIGLITYNCTRLPVQTSSSSKDINIICTFPALPSQVGLQINYSSMQCKQQFGPNADASLVMKPIAFEILATPPNLAGAIGYQLPFSTLGTSVGDSQFMYFSTGAMTQIYARAGTLIMASIMIYSTATAELTCRVSLSGVTL